MESFVHLRNVSFEQAEYISPVKRFIGEKPMMHSLLHDVNLELAAGSWVTLFGKAASGKTTLLRLLTGVINPTAGLLRVNGRLPSANKHAAAGYVSSEELEPLKDTVEKILASFAQTHGIPYYATRLQPIVRALDMEKLLARSPNLLSSSEKLTVNMARAFLSDAPLLLFDDVAETFEAEYLKKILGQLAQGRTVIISTGSVEKAQQLELPIMLLHEGTVAHVGTCDDLALNVACPRILDVWVEGLRYDLLRRLRDQPGVLEVRLITADQFAGQRLRITLHSSRYLPSIYNLMSSADLLKVEEIPPSLADIVARL